MSKVKIYVENGETLEEAQEDIVKAIQYHSSGESHDEDLFEDPAMRSLTDRLEVLHQQTYNNIVKEISEALDKDYTK